MTTSIEGASIVGEVTSLLNQVVSVLTIFCLYHGGENGIVMQKLLSPFQGLLYKPPCFPHPPLLNQSPRKFLVELTDHYLFAALHEMLYTSLMEENHHRVAYLGGAVKRLDDKSAELARQCNALHQEEIIEEIEVILLNAASLGERPNTRARRPPRDGHRSSHRYTGLLVGNTAEQTLDHVTCDLLAVKPEGFVTPGKRREPA